MTITFFSNFLNIHQLPFCEEMIKHVGEDNFRFVATRGMDPDRIAMGFEDMNVTKPFVVRAFENEESHKKALELAVTSDITIMGSAPLEYTEKRMKSNKLTFQYTERLLKTKTNLLKPGFYRSYYRQFFRYRNKNEYVLCASAYTAPDLAKLFFPRKKCFKWGYFPDLDNYCEKKTNLANNLRLKHQEDVSILWVGRLIGLKHPEHAIEVANRLKADSVHFEMNIIGEGPLYSSLEKSIERYNLSDNVHLLGVKNHSEVMTAMKNCDIYLFTSDRWEGWGAVLNESMSYGCAVVANCAIGSVPFLIEDGVNGFCYKDGDIEDLYQKVLELTNSDILRHEVSKNAVQTMRNIWSIENATNNLMVVFESLLNHKAVPQLVGPCSYA